VLYNVLSKVNKRFKNSKKSKKSGKFYYGL